MPDYVVRRLMPIECERLQGFPTVVELKVENMTSDELIACALANGDIIADTENGIVYGTRGPGGKRLDEPRELGFLHPTGYVHINLSACGLKKQVRAHRIIYIAAHGGIPDGYVIDHINCDKSDNRISNLQAVTGEQNSHKAKCDGAYLVNSDPITNKRMIPYEVRDRIAHDYARENCTYKDLALRYGVSKSSVSNIIREYGWTDIRKKVVKKKDGTYKAVEVDETPDTPRYKAMGNSMAVPVMRWIGERIQRAEEEA